MILAKNNIIVKIQSTNKSEYAILNPISGSFDLMNELEYKLLQKFSDGETVNNDFTYYLIERGYAFENSEDQNASVSKAYKTFKDEVKHSQVQLMLVPTYGCNLACTYCFQHGVQEDVDLYSQATLPNNSKKPNLKCK